MIPNYIIAHDDEDDVLSAKIRPPDEKIKPHLDLMAKVHSWILELNAYDYD